MFSNFFKSLFLPLLTVAILSSNLYAKDPGEKIEDFKVSNFDGKTYSFADIKDSKARVIMFWSSECPYVQPYNDRINDFVKTYQEQGVVFWAMNSNNTEPVSMVESHAKEKGYIFPMLKDDKNVVADMFGATRTPEVFVIDQNNVILYHGRISDNREKEKETSLDLKNALDEILAGKEVTNKITKQFGCGIKRVD